MSFLTFLTMEITHPYDPPTEAEPLTAWPRVQIAIVVSPFVAYVAALLWSMR